MRNPIKPYPGRLRSSVTRSPVRGRLYILLTVATLTPIALLSLPMWVTMGLLHDWENDLTDAYREILEGWWALVAPWENK